VIQVFHKPASLGFGDATTATTIIIIGTKYFLITKLCL
jgi:hypothetical protein